MSAYMGAPRVKSLPAPFFYLSSFLSFLLFDRAAGFLPPRPRIVAGRRAQMLSRLAALQRPHPPGAWPLQQSSTTAGLMGRVWLRSCCLFYPVFVSARVIPITDVPFLAGLATKSMAACDNRIHLYPPAPIRLAKLLLV